MHTSRNHTYQAELALSLGMAAFIALFITAVGMGLYPHELLIDPDTPKARAVERIGLVLIGLIVLEGSISSCFVRRSYWAPFAGTLTVFVLFHALPPYLAIALLIACSLSWIARVVR